MEYLKMDESHVGAIAVLEKCVSMIRGVSILFLQN